MKKILSLTLATFAILMLFQSCTLDIGDEVILFEFDMVSGAWATTFKLKPKGKSTTEIESGKYKINGEITKGSKISGKADVDKGFPKKLLIRFIRETPKAQKNIDMGKNAKKFTLKLKINPKTGIIPEQTVTIPKTMIIDPKKDESIKIKMKPKRGTINTGDKLSIFYEKVGSSTAETSAN